MNYPFEIAVSLHFAQYVFSVNLSFLITEVSRPVIQMQNFPFLLQRVLAALQPNQFYKTAQNT